MATWTNRKKNTVNTGKTYDKNETYDKPVQYGGQSTVNWTLKTKN